MTRKHHHRPSPSSSQFSISSYATGGGKPHRGSLRDKKIEDDDDDYSDASASQSLYDESQGDEYEPSEKDDDIDSVSNALDNPSSSQKPTKNIPEINNIQAKSSTNSASNFLNLSQPVASYVKIAPLPIFRGTPSECPITHLSRFNKVCRANGAFSSIDMLTRIFPVTLEDEAALWYDLNIEPYPYLSWDEVKSSFLQAYHRMELVEELRSELMRINQGEKENVRSYFLRLQWILQRWPEHGLSEALLKGVFIDGLRTEFHEWVLIQKPNSLNDALRLAFRFEEMRSIRDTKQKVGEICGFCEGSHEERECEVRERMKELWRQSKEREGKDSVRSISVGERSVNGKVDEADEDNSMKKKSQCQCSKHQCSKKRLMRNSSIISRTSDLD